MLWLALARVAVRLVPLRILGKTLGRSVDSSSSPRFEAMDADRANRLAANTERASLRLPGESKCLPKAVALQWMLRRAGQPSRLVVAVHRTDRTAPHAFHAWVEQGGRMLIGRCERSEYSPVLAFDHPARA